MLLLLNSFLLNRVQLLHNLLHNLLLWPLCLGTPHIHAPAVAAGVVHWLLNVIDERLHAAVGETHEQLDFLLGRGALDFEGQGFASWHGNHRAYLQTV